MILLGEIPKWPTGADCKSAGVCLRRFESCSPHKNQNPNIQNPDPGFLEFGIFRFGICKVAGVAQSIEH
jgi:hypothetical protein